MTTNILPDAKLSRTRVGSSGVRIILALSAGICLTLTFIVPVEWLTVFKCPFLTLTGLPCPFCGFTRAIWAISAGEWLYATVNCPLAWLLYAATLIVLLRNVSGLLPGARKANYFFSKLSIYPSNRVAGIVMTLLLLNWLYRLSLGLT